MAPDGQGAGQGGTGMMFFSYIPNTRPGTGSAGAPCRVPPRGLPPRELHAPRRGAEGRKIFDEQPPRQGATKAPPRLAGVKNQAQTPAAANFDSVAIGGHLARLW